MHQTHFHVVTLVVALLLPAAYGLRLGDADGDEGSLALVSSRSGLSNSTFGCSNDQACCMCRAVSSIKPCIKPKKHSTVYHYDKKNKTEVFEVCCHWITAKEVLTKNKGQVTKTKNLTHINAECLGLHPYDACTTDAGAPVFNKKAIRRTGELIGMAWTNGVELVKKSFKKVRQAVIDKVRGAVDNTKKCFGGGFAGLMKNQKACWELVKFTGQVAMIVTAIACMSVGTCGLGLTIAAGTWATLKTLVDAAQNHKEAANKKLRTATVIFGVLASAGTIVGEVMLGGMLEGIGVQGLLQTVVEKGFKIGRKATNFAVEKILQMCHFVANTTDKDMEEVFVNPDSLAEATEGNPEMKGVSNKCADIQKVLHKIEDGSNMNPECFSLTFGKGMVFHDSADR